jgi:hypothetical protein
MVSARVGGARQGAVGSIHGNLRLLSRDRTQTRALGDSQAGDRKGLKREEEPEEYWSSERERKGESPFKDPIALIGLLAIFFPFLFLIIASSVGLVDLGGK